MSAVSEPAIRMADMDIRRINHPSGLISNNKKIINQLLLPLIIHKNTDFLFGNLTNP